MPNSGVTDIRETNISADKVIQLRYLPGAVSVWWVVGSGRSSCSKVRRRCRDNVRSRPVSRAASRSRRSSHTRGPLSESYRGNKTDFVSGLVELVREQKATLLLDHRTAPNPPSKPDKSPINWLTGKLVGTEKYEWPCSARKLKIFDCFDTSTFKHWFKVISWNELIVVCGMIFRNRFQVFLLVPFEILRLIWFSEFHRFPWTLPICVWLWNGS